MPSFGLRVERTAYRGARKVKMLLISKGKTFEIVYFGLTFSYGLSWYDRNVSMKIRSFQFMYIRL